MKNENVDFAGVDQQSPNDNCYGLDLKWAEFRILITRAITFVNNNNKET